MKRLFFILFFAILCQAAAAQTLKMISLAQTDFSAAKKIIGETKDAYTFTFDNAQKTVHVQGPNKLDLTMPMVAYNKSNSANSRVNVDWTVKHSKITGYTLVYQDSKNVYLLERYKDGQVRRYSRLSTVK